MCELVVPPPPFFLKGAFFFNAIAPLYLTPLPLPLTAPQVTAAAAAAGAARSKAAAAAAPPPSFSEAAVSVTSFRDDAAVSLFFTFFRTNVFVFLRGDQHIFHCI